MAGIFQAPVKPRRPAGLKPATLRDFSGGWNAVDDDEVMSTKFSVTAENVIIGTDGSINGRFGNERFADVKSVVSGNIVNQTYFADFIIVVTNTGEIAKVSDDGTPTAIWNTAIAAALLGSPTGWSALDQVTFVPFKKELVIHNGVDRPVTISDVLVVTYLSDLASGSNVNVPIGKYGCTVANYHVVAGITAAPTQISITSAGTAGTFLGDPAPNDAVNIDVGAYTSLSAKEIRGVAGYRNMLLVGFRDSTLIITLGNYKDAVHVPLYNDTLPRFGFLSQRCVVNLENDLLFMSPHGAASAKRNIFAGLVESKTLSEIIRPEYSHLSRNLTETEEKLNTFAVRDVHDNTVYFFFKDTAVVYKFNEELKIKGWGKVTGWNWSCACESKQGRVFFAYGTRIYRLGNTVFENEEVYADLVNDYDSVYTYGGFVSLGDKVFDSLTRRTWIAQANITLPAVGLMADLVEANPMQWVEYVGEEVDLTWELPWTDFKDGERVKHVRTIKIASKGTARFTIEAYVDGLYKDELGEVIHDPALSMEFVGSSQQGYGGSPAQYYGGGRNSQDPRLYKFPLKFKKVKLKMLASVREKLKISWITMLHTKGNYHRP